MGSHKLNQMVTPTAVALSSVVLLLEQINISLHIWCGPVDLTNAFCFILSSKDHEKQITFSCPKQQYIINILPRAY